MRDKHAGLHRLEVKLPAHVVAALDDAADELGLSRAEVITKALEQWLHL
jgi:metal-responsive CopG/Arc/MetJ family transcriptional regulator|tara:strand:- start:88 stop:234 length:147 start_codon:yes stop_codon:yes gene_type:complete